MMGRRCVSWCDMGDAVSGRQSVYRSSGNNSGRLETPAFELSSEKTDITVCMWVVFAGSHLFLIFLFSAQSHIFFRPLCPFSIRFTSSLPDVFSFFWSEVLDTFSHRPAK